ncbi:MAG: RNA polymerase sigma factor [Solirubrobacterales bacterium]
MELSFEQIYEVHYERLYKLAYRLMGSREEAEDILQEAFLNAYKAYPKFRNESQVGTWLYTIVTNCAYKSMKKLKRLPVYDIAPRFDMTKEEFFEKMKYYEPVENEVMLNCMREQCLQLFLKCMPIKQRTAFVLQVLLGLSCQEVSNIMDISAGAVKTNVYRARLRMKENMEDKCSYINPNSPCQCKNWVAYAVANNKMDMILEIDLDKELDYTSIFKKEMSFLERLVFLYDKYPKMNTGEDFIKKMKNIISEKSLKILS